MSMHALVHSAALLPFIMCFAPQWLSLTVPSSVIVAARRVIAPPSANVPTRRNIPILVICIAALPAVNGTFTRLTCITYVRETRLKGYTSEEYGRGGRPHEPCFAAPPTLMLVFAAAPLRVTMTI